MASLEIKLWQQIDFRPGTQGYDKACSWGGSSCEEPAEFTVIDRAGTPNGACADHMVKYVRDRLKYGD
jgi:hypothetical protein